MEMSNGFSKMKVQGFVKEWQKIEEAASSAIGTIMQKARAQKDDILEAAKGIGIKPKVLRNVIGELKLRAKADDMRDDFAGRNDDEAVVDMRDNVALAAGLPLFDGAGVSAPPKAKPKAKKPDLKVIAEVMEAETETTH